MRQEILPLALVEIAVPHNRVAADAAAGAVHLQDVTVSEVGVGSEGRIVQPLAKGGVKGVVAVQEGDVFSGGQAQPCVAGRSGAAVCRRGAKEALERGVGRQRTRHGGGVVTAVVVYEDTFYVRCNALLLQIPEKGREKLRRFVERYYDGYPNHRHGP